MSYLSKQDKNTSLSKTGNFDFRTNMTIHTEIDCSDIKQYEDIFIEQTEKINSERKARIQKNYYNRMKVKLEEKENKEEG